MPQKRAAVLGFAFLLLLLSLTVPLAVLVFGRGSQLTAAAADQRLRSLPYYQYARGDILDRRDRPLVNIEEPCLVVLPSLLAGTEEAAAVRLSLLTGLDGDVLRERLRAACGSSYQPVVLKTGLTEETAERINAAEIPGVLALTLAARYDRQHTASQLLGAVREQTEGGWAGISGLELAYDSLLASREDTQVRLQVDARGRMQGEAELFRPAAIRRPSLSLTLDRDYQQIAEAALADAGLPGSCVVMDPENGDILALASFPACDPYGWEETPAGAYLQRALLSYPPASTFKTVLAAAALSEGVTPDPETTAADAAGESGAGDDPGSPESDVSESEPGVFVCRGSCTLSDGRTVSCAGGLSHGEVDLGRALALSCNCYFVSLGQTLGGERVLDYCRRLGLDEMTVAGLAADDDTDHLCFDGNQAGELANACLGEAGVSLSPLQEAELFSVFVNGGRLVTPRLVRAEDDGVSGPREHPAACPRQVLRPEVAEELRLMLARVVEEGTGTGAAGEWVSAGGKTGSSETGTVWFSGFFPSDRPRLVTVVCLENGSSGGAEAAAVFRQVADAITLLDGRL